MHGMGGSSLTSDGRKRTFLDVASEWKAASHLLRYSLTLYLVVHHLIVQPSSHGACKVKQTESGFIPEVAECTRSHEILIPEHARYTQPVLPQRMLS